MTQKPENHWTRKVDVEDNGSLVCNMFDLHDRGDEKSPLHLSLWQGRDGHSKTRKVIGTLGQGKPDGDTNKSNSEIGERTHAEKCGGPNLHDWMRH